MEIWLLGGLLACSMMSISPWSGQWGEEEVSQRAGQVLHVEGWMGGIRQFARLSITRYLG